jgi:hypothetical protein
MAENIVAGLFGLTPQMFQNQQYQQDLNRGISMAQLSPGAAAQAGLQASVGQLGRGFAGAMGIEDPQLKLISTRNTIAQQIDQTSPESILQGAQMLAQAGDQQGAMALAQYARQAQSEMAQTQQRLAAGKASMAQASRERSQAIPNDIQVANEIATLEDALSQVENLPADPERTRAKNMLNSRLTELRRLTSKGEKTVAANIKEIGVAETTREPVYLDVNNDLQFIYKKDDSGKQVRVPFTGGVDRATATSKTQVTVDAKGEAAFVTELGKLDAKKVNEAFTTRENAVSTINSLNKLAQLPDNELITGQFATGRVGATNLLATLGLASPTDVDRLSTSQQYQKVAGDVILQTLGGKLGSGFSNADREFIQGLIPQLETNPAARRKLISFMQNKNQEIVKESIRLENYARSNRGLSGFEPKIPMSVAPSQPRPYSGLTDEQLNAKIRAAQQTNR